MTHESLSSILTDPEALLRERDWLRRLARRLVRDEAQAEDVVQDALVVALERPRQARDRSWLAGVVHHVARHLARGEARRARRERERPSRGEGGDPAELVALATAQRELTDAVLALPEPYRTTILLRYFEGLTPEAIAARTGRPAATVRTHARRGLERLRARLEERHGGREAWLAALAPLLRPETGAAAVIAGRWVAAAAVVAVLGGAVALRALAPSPASGPRAVVESAPVAAGEPRAEPVADADDPSGETRRAVEVAAERDSAAGAAGSAPSDGRPVRGRLVDLEGRPLAGLTVEWTPAARPRLEDGWLHLGDQSLEVGPELRERLARQPVLLAFYGVPAEAVDEVTRLLRGEPLPEYVATSGADGRFGLQAPAGKGALTLRDTQRMLGGEVAPIGERTEEPWILVVPRVRLAGRVVDEQGRPIAEARVAVRGQAHGLLLSTALDVPDLGQGSTRTDAQGRFRIDDHPLLPGRQLQVSATGHDARRLPVEGTDESLEVVLRSLEEAPDPVLAGRVLLDSGGPASGATVHFGQRSARTGADGTFRIVTKSRRPATLVATLEGHRYAALEALRPPAEGLELVLGDAPLSITGRVLDVEGEPLAGAIVLLLDGLPVQGWEPSYAEFQSGGVPTSRTTRTENTVSTIGLQVDEQLATASDGSFAVPGLLDRPYRLVFVDPRTLWRRVTDPIPAGTTGVVVRQSADDFRSELRGRVVSRRGEPVAGVEVECSVPTHSGGGLSFSRTSDLRATTDGEGRFVLRDLPRRGVVLSASGDDVETARVPLEGEEREVVLEVGRLVRFQVERVEVQEGDDFEVRDALGEPIPVVGLLPDLRTQHRRMPMEYASEDALFEVEESAATIVVFDGEGAERLRLSVDLRPGEVRRVRL